MIYILALTFPTVILDKDDDIELYTEKYPDEEIEVLELLAIMQAEAAENFLALETINKAIDLCPEDLRASLLQ